MCIFTGITIVDIILMILYGSLAIGLLCSMADDDGPIQNNPDN